MVLSESDAPFFILFFFFLARAQFFRVGFKIKVALHLWCF